MTTHSTRPIRPKKPHPDFALFAHHNGQWCKKVLGKQWYFGKWTDDPKGTAAAELWAEQKDDLLAGRMPRSRSSELTVVDLSNQFLAAKESKVDSGELKQRTWLDYRTVLARVIKVFGKNRVVSDLRPEDFAALRSSFAKTRRGHSLTGDINRTRIVFKWAYDSDLIAAPIKYGQSFDKPTQRVLRVARAEAGPRMFEREAIIGMLNGRKLKDKSKVAGASQPLRAMILLAINGGLGNADVASLPLSSIDLKGGWLDYPRPKTGITRRIPLWRETRKALAEAIEVRPEPQDASNAGRVFLTAKGNTWDRTEASGDPVTKQFAKLLKALELHKKGLNFYSLRRTFRTIASETLDEAAADFIMGHAAGSDDMAARYRQRVDDDRLLTVVNHVRSWLFSKREGK